ncbi:MAG: proline--tRNA ligase [Deltaproteobacteria bacterium]|nr:proline--tRNA ligase [Deltaproteobacteria bacterium]
MRYSQLLIPTLREDPAEAEVASHRLMMRSGMIRKVAAGIYSTLPLGQRVIQKTKQIIREEMNRAGGQEVFLPFIQPAELWEESGRWEVYGKEMLRLRDRGDRQFCLGPTHEEVITDLVRSTVNSYRQLPINLYQIHIKFRDEIRPRFGMMRAREFIMKDAYSFDIDENGAEESYRKMYEAYSRIFSRLGLTFRAVEADTGPIGGNFSHEFMVLADTGEDIIVTCTGCDYAANTEKAEIAKPVVSDADPAKFQALKRVETPDMRTIEEVAGFLNVLPEDLIKTLVFTSSQGPVVALVRGDHDINEVKLRNYLKCDSLELAGEEVIEKITGAPRGFAGPIGMKNVRIIADYGLQGCCNMVTGGNERDVHVVNVNFGRDVSVDEFADLRSAQAGDSCPRCNKLLSTTRGIEVGHIFKLGTKYSKAMNCSYLDREGKAQPMIMGCYGIGVGRTVAAAIEQSHDENGIIFPEPIAPFSVIVVPVNTNDAVQMEIAVNLYNGLAAKGVDVLLDDRDERPGSKFKDADLIGVPLRVTVGKNAVEKKYLDIKERKGGEAQQVAIDDAVAVIERRLKQPEV